MRPNSVLALLSAMAVAMILWQTPSQDAAGMLGRAASVSTSASVASVVGLVAGGAAGEWGSRRHNKCLLLVSAVAYWGTTGAASVAVYAWHSASSAHIPAASVGGTSCLYGNVSGGPSQDHRICLEFWRSIPVSRAFRVWLQKFRAAQLGDNDARHLLSNLEETAVCCGFAPAQECRVGWRWPGNTSLGLDDAAWNDALERSDVPAAEAMQACMYNSSEPGSDRHLMYRPSGQCDGARQARNPGCMHLLPVLSLCDEGRPHRRGCALEFATWGQSILLPLAVAVAILVPGTCWCCCISFGLLIHRKYSDVVPSDPMVVPPEYALYGKDYPREAWEPAARELRRRRRIAEAGRAAGVQADEGAKA